MQGIIKSILWGASVIIFSFSLHTPTYADAFSGADYSTASTQAETTQTNRRSTRSTRSARRDGGGRPPGCPSAWCGCWARLQFGISNSRLNLAMNWRHHGRPAQKGCVGCVAIMGRRGGGHVGIVQGYQNGHPILRSGNWGRRVATHVVHASRIISYRYV